jgi:NitT/TauT family transport system substrate-binding protein
VYLPPGPLVTRRTALATGGVLLAAAAGCASTSSHRATPGAAKKPNGPPTKLTYVTGLARYGREDYVDVAIDKQYFDEVGIEVDVQAGEAGDSNRKAVASGKVQFAAVDLSGQIIAKANAAAKNTALDTIVVAAIHQRTIVALMAKQTSGISRPRDLVGRHLVQAIGAAPKTLFPAYAQLAGFRADLVRWDEGDGTSLIGLLAAGKADAIGQFIPAQGTVEHIAGPVNVLSYDQVLTALYGNGIITNPIWAKAHQDVVKRFVSALLRGLDYACAHPDEAGKIIERRTSGLTTAALAAEELRRMAGYVGTDAAGKTTTLGSLDEARVMGAIAILQGTGVMPSGLQPRDVVDFDLAAWRQS